MGLIYFAIGVPAVLQCLRNNERKVWYGGTKASESTPLEGDNVTCNGSSGAFSTCYVTFTVRETMPGPVYVVWGSVGRSVVRGLCFVCFLRTGGVSKEVGREWCVCVCNKSCLPA
jgi:hypothetical protein